MPITPSQLASRIITLIYLQLDTNTLGDLSFLFSRYQVFLHGSHNFPRQRKYEQLRALSDTVLQRLVLSHVQSNSKTVRPRDYINPNTVSSPTVALFPMGEHIFSNPVTKCHGQEELLQINTPPCSSTSPCPVVAPLNCIQYQRKSQLASPSGSLVLSSVWWVCSLAISRYVRWLRKSEHCCSSSVFPLPYSAKLCWCGDRDRRRSSSAPGGGRSCPPRVYPLRRTF